MSLGDDLENFFVALLDKLKVQINNKNDPALAHYIDTFYMHIKPIEQLDDLMAHLFEDYIVERNDKPSPTFPGAEQSPEKMPDGMVAPDILGTLKSNIARMGILTLSQYS